MSDLFLWVDLETTGLDPSKDVILEVAAILTDDTLKELEAFTTVIDQSGWWAAASGERRRLVAPEVREMHEASGLLGESLVPYGDAMGANQAGYRLSALFNDHDHDRIILAGSSVHFDREFIRRAWSWLDGMLHYRHLDISSVETLLRVAGVEFERGDRPHRAEPDIRDTLELARRIVVWANDAGGIHSIVQAIHGGVS